MACIPLGGWVEGDHEDEILEEMLINVGERKRKTPQVQDTASAHHLRPHLSPTARGPGQHNRRGSNYTFEENFLANKMS